ncbi:MAG: ATP-binding protein [Lachnospiraceae bacterium]|nr:ATP-binding protein [Lachnospiraceae bacterium]
MITTSLKEIIHVNFQGLATPVRVAYTWEDITIAPAEKEVLKRACDRYRLRNRLGDRWGLKKKNAYGNGVSVLLYGPPGTGKTMAAQVVSGELALPLYRVDISQIFSKYIGETEKNLGIIFDAAKKSNVILFFDEADALFAKRTEVNQSNDKYSNSETAYLLQKIEEYDGMSILATNYYNNFDQAFVRRVTFSVHMESPNAAQRYALWTGILPDETPVDKEIDFNFLAEKFELSGSNIKAILYSAAYMAGAEGASIGPKHIAKAMQMEFKKLGMLIDAGSFGMFGIYIR